MKHLRWIPVVLVALVVGCKKDNKMGLASVSTTAASSITANSAQTGGVISGTGGSSISGSGICWATHNKPSVSDSIIASSATGTGSFTSALANLNANMMYYVRAFVINGVGTAYGNTDSFMTAKGLPTVTTMVISNNAALKAQSGGNVINDGGASVTARGICWSTSQHPTISNAKTSDGAGTGSFIDSLTNLSVTTYYVRAYATNSYGTAYGNELSFTVSTTGTVADIDGNVYPTVVIGSQTWMATNLRVTHYQNGDTILNGFTNTSFDWYNNFLTRAYIGAYTFPNGDTANKAAYGLLYNNYVCNDLRGICPDGWHVPTEAEWQTLEYYEGMAASDTSVYGSRGTVAAKFMKGGASGLDVQLAGQLFINDIGDTRYNFFNVGGIYWSSTSENTGRIGNYFRRFNQTLNSIERGIDYGYAGSIRFVKN